MPINVSWQRWLHRAPRQHSETARRSATADRGDGFLVA